MDRTSHSSDDDVTCELANLIDAARRLSRQLGAVLAEDGMREDTWRALHSLQQSPGLLMGELADALTLSNATVTRLVSELADNGLVFRRPGDDDGRKAVVYVSRTGLARLDKLNRLIESRLGDIPAWTDLVAATQSTIERPA